MTKGLTDLTVKRAKPPASGRLELKDTVVRGLRLRVTQSGVKTFALKCYVHGRETRLTLGRYPELSVAQARTKALKVLGRARGGEDPRQQRPSSSSSHSFDQVLQEYLRFLERKSDATNGKPSLAYRNELDRLLHREFVPVFRNRDVRKIARTDVMDVVHGILNRPHRGPSGRAISKESPSAANHALSYIKTFFAWCEGQGKVDVDLMRPLSSPAPKRKRNRILSDDELAQIWSAAMTYGYPYGHIVRLLMITGQRRSEVTRLRRDNIDVTQALWRVPADQNKSGREYLVPLGSLASEILEVALCADTDLLFPAPNAPDRQFSGWSKSKNKLDLESGVEEWVLHDLRRTASTTMARLGVLPHIKERVLNHALGGIEGTYDVHDYLDQKREALTRLNDHIVGLIGSR